MGEIILSSGIICQVDDEDLERLNSHRWFVIKKKHTCYAVAFKKVDGKTVSTTMHRLLTAAKDGELVDHMDRNGLNNKKSNLRICNISENSTNRKKKAGTSSNYRGVSYAKKNKAWFVFISKNKKKKFIGAFKDEEQAARAYDREAKILHGQFANLNFEH